MHKIWQPIVRSRNC